MSHPRTLRFELAYDGSCFAGWARQPGARTVESVLRRCLEPVLPDMRSLAVGGRTDRGVHATGQVFSLRTRSDVGLPELVSRMNAAAPNELVVLQARTVPHWFHAQFSAVARSYVLLWPGQELAKCVDRIQVLVQGLLGTHDFRAFSRATPKTKSTVRHLHRASVRALQTSDYVGIRFDIMASSFLRRQVRVMTATAVREALAGSPDDALTRLAQARNRAATAEPAPADYLHLARVHYDPWLPRRVRTARRG